MESRRSSRRSLCTAILILALSLGAGSSQAQADCNDNPWAPGWMPGWQPIFQGVDWAGACTTRLPSNPNAAGIRTQNANLARIDLHAPGIEIFVTPRSGSTLETKGQLASEFLCDYGLQLAVNANFFKPCCRSESDPPRKSQDIADDLLGLAVSQGHPVSELACCSNPANGAALLLTQDNKASVQRLITGTPAGVFNAVGGGPLLLLNGVDQFSPESDTALPPPIPPLVAARTAAGLSQDGRYLYLLAIDGTDGNTSTQGAAFYDVAEWLLRLGADSGLNLDGGGSTTMAMRQAGGAVDVLNSPGESCNQRFVGALLGVRAKPLEKSFVPPHCKTASCGPPLSLPSAGAPPWPAELPVYDHIVIVVEENKDYDEIIGQTKVAPYINKLRNEGANFTRFYAEEHHSQGNYFWLLSGGRQDVSFDDTIPTPQNDPFYPFTASNLAQQLIAKGRSFKGYSEALPAIGSTVNGSGYYARKHVPWISFQNVPDGTTIATSSNLRFLDFPTSYDSLPTVSFVIPNLIDDMHSASIQDGDAWLKQNLDGYYQWAKTHNSLLIVTFDEDDDTFGYEGLTDPACSDPSRQNRIATIFAGAHVKPGDYPEGKGVTHVNVLRTLEAMYGLGRSGAQQPNALKFGISDDFIVKDVFAAPQ